MLDDFECYAIVGWSILGFTSFLLSDIPRWARSRVWRIVTNTVGLVALGVTVRQVIDSGCSYHVPFGLKIIGGIGLIVFSLLLVYTAFLEIPYARWHRPGDETKRPTPVATGTFALSRHPDTLWLIGWLISFVLVVPGPKAICLATVWLILKLVFTFLQDRWLYPSTLQDYENYRRNVPYLLPTGYSIRNAYRTWRRKHETISREDE